MTLTEILLSVIVYVVLWYLAGVRHRYLTAQKVVDNYKSTIPEFYTEYTGSYVYLYSKNNKFQCQDINIDTLAKSFYNLKNIPVAKVLDNSTDIHFITGTVVKEIEVSASYE